MTSSAELGLYAVPYTAYGCIRTVSYGLRAQPYPYRISDFKKGRRYGTDADTAVDGIIRYIWVIP